MTRKPQDLANLVNMTVMMGLMSPTDYISKEAFHRDARKLLRIVAVELGLDAEDFVIASNKGGAAVSGEITLHTSRLYVQLHKPVSRGETMSVLFRSCDGQRDFVGGRNQFIDLASLGHPEKFTEFIVSLRKLEKLDNPERSGWGLPKIISATPSSMRPRI